MDVHVSASERLHFSKSEASVSAPTLNVTHLEAVKERQRGRNNEGWLVGGREEPSWARSMWVCALMGWGVRVTPITLPSHVAAKTAYVCERTCVRGHVHAAMDLRPADHWLNIVSSNGTSGFRLGFKLHEALNSHFTVFPPALFNSTNKKKSLSKRSSKR